MREPLLHIQLSQQEIIAVERALRGLMTYRIFPPRTIYFHKVSESLSGRIVKGMHDGLFSQLLLYFRTYKLVPRTVDHD